MNSSYNVTKKSVYFLGIVHVCSLYFVGISLAYQINNPA